MKIIYVDMSVDGHHITYLSTLVKQENIEPVLILPEKIDIDCKQYIYKTKESGKRTLKTFKKWLKEVSSFVEKEKPDIVHFLYGDAFYRFFGAGLSYFKKYKTILTLHWIKEGVFGILSTKMICSNVDIVVVHSDYIKKLFEKNNIKNVHHIEYPQFNEQKLSKETACQYFDLNINIPTIACIGNTRYDKGLDVLLDALKNITCPFQLLIAGKEESFDRRYIEEKSATYRDNVRMCLHYLNDDELSNALCASDIIALPYRKKFNGASGPLGEGVALGKCIVGPNHGTLGYTIENNHLGYTFESENSDDLAKTLYKALTSHFEQDELYCMYKDSLGVNAFVEKYNFLYKLLLK